jgi:hypothetical protein
MPVRNPQLVFDKAGKIAYLVSLPRGDRRRTMKATLQVPTLLDGDLPYEFDPELAVKVDRGELELKDLKPADRKEVKAAMTQFQKHVAKGGKFARKALGADEAKQAKTLSDIQPGDKVFPIPHRSGG